jgi:hypothetical protein
MRLRVAPLAAAGLVLLGGLNVGLLAAVLAQSTGRSTRKGEHGMDSAGGKVC